MKKIFNFKIIAIIVFLVGLVLVGISGWGIYRNIEKAKYLPIAGSSDMMRRAAAINEAIKKGEKSYSYETTETPMMGQIKN